MTGWGDRCGSRCGVAGRLKAGQDMIALCRSDDCRCDGAMLMDNNQFVPGTSFPARIQETPKHSVTAEHLRDPCEEVSPTAACPNANLWFILKDEGNRRLSLLVREKLLIILLKHLNFRYIIALLVESRMCKNFQRVSPWHLPPCFLLSFFLPWKAVEGFRSG